MRVLTRSISSMPVRALSIIVLFLVFGYFIHGVFYQNKVLSNVYVGSLNLSGKTSSEAQLLLSGYTHELENSGISLELEGQTLFIPLMEFGISFDKDQAIKKAMAVGRESGIFGNVFKKAQLPFHKEKVAFPYIVNSDKFTALQEKLFSGRDVPAKNATVVFEFGQPQLKKEVAGSVVDRSLFLEAFKAQLNSLSPSSIPVVKIPDVPSISSENTSRAFLKAKELNDHDITLTYASLSWKLTNAELLSLLEFHPSGMPGGVAARFTFGESPISVVRVYTSGVSPSELEVGINDIEMNTYISRIASTIDRPKRDATLQFDGGKVTAFTPAQDGSVLDKARAAKLIQNKLSIANEIPEKRIVIALPVAVEKARIANDEVNSYGIKELIGRGTSSYSGSIPNRIYNLTLGAGRLSGTIIAPGEAFSFNKVVGEISGATGYKQAYVISAGRTVLDDGGGICQVSTTVFRAALNAGLPIISRTAHAYRVGYYEQGGARVGFDATVWSPAVDFQFKNDTEHHLLIQAITDPATARMQVDIYGTSDGRTVSISEPVITNQTPALPDKNQEDPSLPKGTVKQVDFAAPGADVSFTRKVFKGDTLIQDNVFRSRYRPWQAVFLVGTGG